jgi:hypothetical protein
VSPSFEFSSDACLSGGGAHFLDDWFYVNWRVDGPLYAQAHINVLRAIDNFVCDQALGALVGGRSCFNPYG